MLKKLLNKETISYLFFGILTTVVNYGTFYIFYNAMALASTIANLIAFVFAVIFAYIVNKLFVFESKSWAFAVIGPEMLQFLLSRIFSFLIEEAGLLLADPVLDLGRYTVFTLFGIEVDGVLLAKLALAVIVVILNYFFCKLMIFKKK